MKFTQTHAESFAHAKDFFTKYPDALAAVDQLIAEKGGVAAAIRYGAEAVQTEVHDKVASTAAVHESKSTLSTTFAAVRHTASYFAEHLADTLLGEGDTTGFEWLYNSKSPVSSLEELLYNAKQHENVINDNGTLRKKYAQLQNELVQYKKALAEAGSATVQDATETAERELALEKYAPAVSALIYTAYHYLRIASPTLFAEWKARVARSSAKTDPASTETTTPVTATNSATTPAAETAPQTSSTAG